MQAGYKLLSALFALALLAPPAAEQQSAKSGTFTGKWGLQAAGRLLQTAGRSEKYTFPTGGGRVSR
jgi:hypothetical protein